MLWLDLHGLALSGGFFIHCGPVFYGHSMRFLLRMGKNHLGFLHKANAKRQCLFMFCPTTVAITYLKNFWLGLPCFICGYHLSKHF